MADARAGRFSGVPRAGAFGLTGFTSGSISSSSSDSSFVVGFFTGVLGFAFCGVLGAIFVGDFLLAAATDNRENQTLVQT